MRRRDVLVGSAGLGLVLGMVGAKAPRSFLGRPRAEVHTDRHEVTLLDARGRVVWTVGGRGAEEGRFESPSAALVDPEGQVWVADRGNHRLVVLSAEGRVLRVIERAVGERLTAMRDLTLDNDGRVLASDPGNHRLLRWEKDGSVTPLGAFGTCRRGLNYPTGIAVDDAGRIHVADTGNRRVSVLDDVGRVVRTYAEGDTSPTGIWMTGWSEARVASAQAVQTVAFPA